MFNALRILFGDVVFRFRQLRRISESDWYPVNALSQGRFGTVVRFQHSNPLPVLSGIWDALNDFQSSIAGASGADAAKYIRKAYKEFCKQYGKEIVDAAPIFSSDIASQKVFERIEITEAANNILVRAGYTDPLRSPGPQGGKEAIPIKLLRSNYQHMLAEKAGLQNDPDTLNFLAGIQYKSSTYINYESHTDPDAQYRLYTILKPLSVEVKIPRGPEIEEIEGGTIFTSYPKTNHEFAQVTRTITFARGATPYILCDHGVSGSIDDEDENEFNSAQIQPDR